MSIDVAGEPATARGEERFQTIDNLSPIGIFEADVTGCCTFMNPVWEIVCQQSVDKALGFGWLDVVHAEDRALFAEPLAGHTRPDVPVEQHFRIVRPSGEVRGLRVRLGRILSSDGVHVGWSGTPPRQRSTISRCESGRRAHPRRVDATRTDHLALPASVQTNREIALRLRLSPGTVKNRIGPLLPKLGASDRIQAVAIALRLGLLDGPGDPLDPAPELPPLPYFNLGEFE